MKSSLPAFAHAGIAAPQLGPENIETVQHVLYFRGDHVLGLDGGSFWNILFRAMDHADEQNRRRLAAAFPEEAYAFYQSRSSDGVDRLRRFVSGHLPTPAHV